MEFTSQLILVTLAGLMCGVYGDEPRRSIDQLINQAQSNKPAKAFNFFWDTENHLALREYDIVMPQEEYLRTHMPHREKRATAVHRRSMWPNNVVYYQITRAFSAAEKAEIRHSFNLWERATCLTFRESKSAKNRIQIVNENDGCWSYVGMIGGTQKMGLSPGCVYQEVILHEIGHALGLEHEQTHPRRDDYVTIVFENIQQGLSNQFDINNFGYIENKYPRIPYDYESIMHYGKTAFGRSGLVTIKTKDSRYQNIIGTAQDLSHYDIQTINEMYGCASFAAQNNEDENDVSDDCINVAGDDLCAYFMEETGVCQGEAEFMAEECTKACGVC